MAWECVQKVVG